MNVETANEGQGLTPSGGGGRLAASVNELMMGIVVILLCSGWTWVWVRQYTLDGHPIIDGNMFKDVLYIVLGYAFGAAGVKKGVEQGTFAALSPPTKNGMTTTTVTPTTVTTTGPTREAP